MSFKPINEHPFAIARWLVGQTRAEQAVDLSLTPNYLAKLEYGEHPVSSNVQAKFEEWCNTQARRLKKTAKDHRKGDWKRELLRTLADAISELPEEL